MCRSATSLVTALALLVLPTAARAWTAPQTLAPVFPNGSHAVPGGVLLGGARAPVGFAARGPAGFAPIAPWFSPPASERVEASGVDATGAATILTVRAHTPDQRVRAYVRSAAGVLGPAATLSPPGGQATDPVLSVAPDGTAIAAWRVEEGGRFRTQASIRPPHGGFGPAQTVSAADGVGTALTVSAADGGTVAVGYASSDTPNVVVASARRGSRRLGGTSRVPVDPDGAPAQLALAASPAGRVAVVVERGAPVETDLAVGTAGRALRRPERLLRASDAEDIESDGPAAAFDGAGDLIVVALRHVGAAGRQAVVSVGGGAPRSLSPAGAQAVAPRIAVGTGRQALVTWTQFSGDRSVAVAAPVRDGVVAAPRALTPPQGHATTVSGAIDPDGTSVVAWAAPGTGAHGPLLAVTG